MGNWNQVYFIPVGNDSAIELTPKENIYNAILNRSFAKQSPQTPNPQKSVAPKQQFILRMQQDAAGSI